jgi:apolipoprotein N-acyltransferase
MAACLFLSLASALLLPLALPNDLYAQGNPFVGAVALAPLFAAMVLAPSFGAASLAGAVFGAVSTFFAHYWLLFFHEFSVWTVSGVVLGYAGYNAILGPVLRAVALASRRARPLALGAAWTVYEYVKSSGFLGFPWGLVSHPFGAVLPVIQVAAVYGVWGVSLVAALVNAVAAEGLLAAWGAGLPAFVRRGHAVIVGLLVAATLGYGGWSLARPAAVADHLAVVLVQHNADPWQAGNDEAAIGEAQDLTRQALAGGRADLVVWSETIIPYLVREGQLARFLERFPRPAPIGEFLKEIGTPLLLGSPFQASGDAGYLNAALLLSPRGDLLGYYGKQQLVPIAERVPFWDLEVVRVFFEKALGLTEGWTPGDGARALRLPRGGKPDVALAAPICFEDAFPDLCRRLVGSGAQVLANLTNVSWSRRKSAMVQMIIAARFRGVENGCALLRATNGGVTSVIGARGEMLAEAPIFEPAFLRVDVPLYAGAGRTPYARWGDLLPWLLAAAIGAGMIARVVLRGRPDSLDNPKG